MNSIYTQLPAAVGTWPPGNGPCGGQAGPLGGGTEPAESLASALWPWESRKGPGLGSHLQGGAVTGLIRDSVGTRVAQTPCPASQQRQQSRPEHTCEFLPSSRAPEGWPGFLQGSPPSPRLRLGWSARRPLTFPPNPQPTPPSPGRHPSSSWCTRASGCSCRYSWCPSCRCSSGWTPPTGAGCAVRPAAGLGGWGRGVGGERGVGSQRFPGRSRDPGPGRRAGRMESRTRCPHSRLHVGAARPPTRAHLQMALEPTSWDGALRRGHGVVVPVGPGGSREPGPSWAAR